MTFSIFEVLMLICFGISWPFSIIRSYRARSARGKSLLFLVLLEMAYTCGILYKLIDSTDAALVLYIINFLMVMADIALYARNARLDRQRAKSINECEEINS